MHRNSSKSPRSRLAALFIVTIASSVGVDVEALSISSPPERVAVRGDSEKQRATIAWAAERFAEAGLDFPLPSIHLHEGTLQCGGNGGFTDVLAEGVTVHICVEDGTDLARKVLHELSHVWDFAYGGTSPQTRADFLALRGLRDWNDRNDDWPERGAEQAAEIIAWGLGESVAPIPTRVGLVGPDDLDSLASAFQLLVGAPPLWMEDVNHLRSLKSSGSWQDV